ncbi:hypothetical protein GCM10009122_03230 [Fulvivirga kasyanovii]
MKRDSKTLQAKNKNNYFPAESVADLAEDSASLGAKIIKTQSCYTKYSDSKYSTGQGGLIPIFTSSYSFSFQS